jgi:hypothetical protein
MKKLIEIYGLYFALIITFLLILSLTILTYNALMNPTIDNAALVVIILISDAYIFFKKHKQ